MVSRTPHIKYGTLDTATVDNQAVAKFNTGAFAHTALLGLDYQHTRYDQYFYNGYAPADSAGPSLNLVAPVYSQAISPPNNMMPTSNVVDLAQTGIYAQDQIIIGKLTVVGGSSTCLAVTTCTFGAGRLVLAGLRYPWQ